jgi:hypothetical protein
MPYCTILYCIILYSIVLYYTVLYYILLNCAEAEGKFQGYGKGHPSISQGKENYSIYITTREIYCGVTLKQGRKILHSDSEVREGNYI